MKKIALLFALLLVVGATSAVAQARFRLSVAYRVSRPYASGFVFVQRPAPFVVYRPYPHHFVLERVYVKHFHSRFRTYHPVRGCWRHYRCGY